MKMPQNFGIVAFLPVVAFITCLVTALERNDDSLLWGPYRPNLYFGMRPRVPKSFSFGLMWTSVANGQLRINTLRHSCEQSDRMSEYGWSRYQPRTGGVQIIIDPENNLNLTITLVKVADGTMKGSWGVHVDGKLRNTADGRYGASITWYMAVEDGGPSVSNELNCRESPLSNEIQCPGKSSQLGSFNIQLPMKKIENSRLNMNVSLWGLKVPDQDLWKAKGKYIEVLENIHH
jgi:mannosyl-oligosaccharide glucosidase